MVMAICKLKLIGSCDELICPKLYRAVEYEVLYDEL